MKKSLLFFTLFIVISFVCFYPLTGYSQQEDRFVIIENKLKDISSPGLNEKVELAVSGATIQEFLKAIAESHNLNISIDPSLNHRIYNNFTDEKVINVLMFIVREFDLDIRFVGSIMSFYKYIPPEVAKAIIPQKEIIVKFNNYTNVLTLDLKNDSLDKVAKKITQTSKKNVVFSPSLANKQISVYLEDMPFDNALEKMAFANNLKVIKTEDNSYLIQPLEEGELAQGLNAGKKNKRTPVNNNPAGNAAGGANAPIFLDVTKGDSIPGQPRINLITFEGQNVSIDNAIKLVAAETGIPYFLFSEVKGNISIKADRVTFDQFLSYILQGTDYTYKKEINLYLIGDRKLEGLRANRVFQFLYRSYSDVQEIIPAEIKKSVEIKEFKELNSILLTGSLPQIIEIEAFLRKLDRVVPMVMIEVIMLDVRKGRTIATGISAGLSDSVKTGGTLLPGLNFNLSSKSINNFLSYLGSNGVINIGKVTPSFYVGLKALESNNNVDVRQMPKLSTLNGHDANLTIGSTRYYSIQKSNIIGTGLTPSVTNVQEWIPVQANLGIKIKPVVAGDDQVTLNIDVHISDFTAPPANNAPPPSSNSQFTSIIRVKNEEMIVLGGIERLEKSDNTSGTPILSRIPIIKWLFSSRTKSRSKIVSVVFIKPTIIY